MLSSKVVGAAEPNKFGAVLLSPLGLIYNSYQATGFKERWIQECDHQYAAPQVALKQHQEFLDSYKHLSTAPQRAPQRVLRAVKLILMGPRIRKHRKACVDAVGRNSFWYNHMYCFTKYFTSHRHVGHDQKINKY